MDEIKLSIVVPVYNMEAYLPGCLDALLAQSLQEIEVICVDDGSDDDSPQILQQYSKQDARVRIIRLNGNSGAGKARNAGIDAATGAYMGFMDADDRADACMYEQLYQAAIQDRSGIAACYPYCFDDKTNAPADVYYFRYAEEQLNNKERKTIYNSGDITTILPYMPVVPWNKIYNTQLVRDTGARFAQGMMHEDFLFYWQVMTGASSLSLIRERWYRYRVNRHASLSAGRIEATYEDIPLIFSSMEERLPVLSEPPVKEQYELFKLWHLLSWCNQLFRNEIDKAQQSRFFEMISGMLRQLPAPLVLSAMDKLQYLLIKNDHPLLFRLKVWMDQLKTGKV